MEFVEQLKSSVDIVQVVGEYVRLRKAGPTRFVGLCPFHSEKTPSFGVHPVHQFYKCFGCGAGGDVLKFVMEIERVSFYEALKLLAERHGIPLPRRAEYSDPETRLRAAIYQMHEIAEEAYREHLQGPAGKEARTYLQKRGVSTAIAESFGLGYADRSGRFLVRIFEQRKFTPDQIEASGLLGRRPDGSFYDRFRNRLMFPIHNESGKIIGFGGRALDPGDEPKYLNSPETSIYKKSYTLYNLHRAKGGMRKADRVVLVEGYMDVIGVSAAGISEVVATCGTALTPHQVQAMKRHAGKVTVNFDPDSAGANAAERSISLLLDEGVHVRIVELEGGLDPDEYCKEHGPAAYGRKVENARNYFYWLADRARAKYDMRTAEGRVEGFQFLLPAIRRLSDKIERVAVVNDIAGYLGVDADLVLENFRKIAAERRETPILKHTEPLRADEKILLSLLLSNPEARQRLLPELQEIPVWQQFRTHRIFEALFSLHQAGVPYSYTELHDRLDEEDRSLLATAVLLNETDEAAQSLEQGVACLRSLQRSHQELQRAALKTRIREAERGGNMQEAIRLAQELGQMEKA